MNSSIAVFKVFIKSNKNRTVFIVDRKLDKVVETHFLGKKFAIRCMNLVDHPGWTLDALVSTIL